MPTLQTRLSHNPQLSVPSPSLSPANESNLGPLTASLHPENKDNLSHGKTPALRGNIKKGQITKTGTDTTHYQRDTSRLGQAPKTLALIITSPPL